MQSEPSPIRPTLFDRLRRDPDLLTLIEKADGVLAAMGYTDHGRRHVTLVAVNAARLLSTLRYDPRTCDLAAVAGLLHDIGNCAGRENHASIGAAMVYGLLTARGVSPADAADVMAAVGNHDETEGGVPVSPIAAALIIADKADIHRSRVRTRDPESFDVHDRVNYTVTKAELDADPRERTITLRMTADTNVASVNELASLFDARFAMSADAARFLNCRYRASVNGERIR